MAIYYFYIIIIHLVHVSCKLAEISEDYNCSPLINALWISASSFIEGKHANTVITKDASLDYGMEVLSCGIAKFGVVFRYFYLKPTESLKAGDRTTVFNSAYSTFYLVVGQGPETTANRLLSLSKLNNNANIIQVYSNTSRNQSEYILVSSWTQYKMSNIVIYRVSGHKIEIMFYDPFVIKSDKRGFIYSLSLPEDETKIKAFWHTFDERQINLDGYPLRVCIFAYPGTSSPVFDKNQTLIRYKLRDGNLIAALAEAMNFVPIYFTPTDGNTYGGALNNGTLLGSILDIDSGQADILGNIRPIKSYGQANAQFLFPADEMKFTFLVPKIDEGFVVSYLRIYDTTTSIALFGTFIGTAAIWYTLQKFYYRMASTFYATYNIEGSTLRFEDILQTLFGAMLLSSQKSRSKMYERTLFICMILFSMVTCYTYQGKMVELLNASRISLDIKDVEELAHSNLKIRTVYGFKDLLKHIAEADESGVYMKLYKRQELSDNVTDNLRRVGIERDSALMWSYTSSKLYSIKMYSNTTGVSLFHIINGPPMRYNAHIVNSDCPYIDRLNKILMRIRQSGLVVKWREDFYQSLIVETLKRPYEVKELDVYTMDELSFIFISLFICDCICVGICCIEIFVHYGLSYGRK